MVLMSKDLVRESRKDNEEKKKTNKQKTHATKDNDKRHSAGRCRRRKYSIINEA
jgi:hypothetical protein